MNALAHVPRSRPREAPLWLLALGLALLLNGGLLVGFGLMLLGMGLQDGPVSPALPEEEAVATIYVEAPEPVPLPKAEAQKPLFTRTSPDQAAEPVVKTNRIGERDTRATSDRAPDPNAPPLPSQAGLEATPVRDIETTESRYRDGALSPSPPAPAPLPVAAAPLPDARSPSAAPETPQPKLAGVEDGQGPPPPRESLLQGPNPVDVQVPKEVAAGDLPKSQPERKQTGETPPLKTAELPPQRVKPTPETPPFQGFQRKTAVLGSISRSGRSALDVDDTELGRYQAQISRAVELEWQRNCVRHRDFITPGFLTVRFYVETNGRVRSVQFVGDMETGEVQKGFTLNSIRNAEIPAMPEALRKAYEGDTLELIFRFYF